MKKLIAISIALIMMSGLNLKAQTQPTPPAAPSNSNTNININKNTNSNNKTSNAISFSYHTDEDEGGNTSISTNKTDKSYVLKARFGTHKTEDIRILLFDQLGDKNHTNKNGSDTWTANSNEEQVYIITLSNGRLNMNINKKVASPSLVNKFESIGDVAKMLISNNAHNESEQLRRDAEQLLRDAERLKEAAEKMKAEAKRLSQYGTEEHKHLAQAAIELATEAKKMAEEASYKGGRNPITIELLRSNKTLFLDDHQHNHGYNNIDWLWPYLQEQLIDNMVNDNLIDGDDDIYFLMDDSGLYVNGIHASNSLFIKYNNLVNNFYTVGKTRFLFHKYGDHIVVINGNNELKECIEGLVQEKFITSDKQAVLFEINGGSAKKDKVLLSNQELNELNELLRSYNIIPAPGKILEIIKKGNFKVGYSMDKTHLGTWSFED